MERSGIDISSIVLKLKQEQENKATNDKAKENTNAERLKKIETIKQNIYEIVLKYNKAFENSNLDYKLYQFDNSKFVESPRKSIQIVMKNTNEEINLLSDKYLLIESFINDGDFRISNSGSNKIEFNGKVDTASIEQIVNHLNKYINDRAKEI